MAKKRRTRQQKIKAKQRRHKSYTSPPAATKLEPETSVEVVEETTKTQQLTEHKSLLLSLGLFAALLLVQLLVWFVWG